MSRPVMAVPETARTADPTLDTATLEFLAEELDDLITGGGGGGESITELSEDGSPQLGGNLDADLNDIQDVDQLNAVSIWQAVSTPASASNVLSVDLALGEVFDTTLDENTAVTLTNGTVGRSKRVIIAFTQDGTGGRTVSWTNVSFPGGDPPDIDPAASATTLVEVIAVGDTYFGVGAAPLDKSYISLYGSDSDTAIDATATDVDSHRIGFDFTVTEVRGSLRSACTTGTFTVDVNVGGSSILSTKLTFDATETSTTSASVPAVISAASIADDSLISIDIDDEGDGTATGLEVKLIGYQVVV